MIESFFVLLLDFYLLNIYIFRQAAGDMRITDDLAAEKNTAGK